MALIPVPVRDQHDVAMAAGRGWFAWRLPSGDLATLNGALLVHKDQHEMVWLLSGGRPVPVPESRNQGPFLALSAHPDMAAVSWPLRMEHFR